MPDNKIQLIIEAVDKSKAAFGELKEHINGIGDSTAKVSAKSSSLLAGLKENWVAVTAAVAAALYAIDKVNRAIGGVIMAAARYETLGVVMRVVGNNAGYTGEQMDTFAKGLEKTGISMIGARESLTRMAQAQIDLTKSTQLARVAQDAAVIGNINSSEAFQRLVYGIQSAQVEMLRTVGINVNFENSYQRVAKETGRAAASFSESEKAAIRMNAVLEAGAGIAGTYEDAMGTAGKQLLSLERHFENLKVLAGEAFTPALAEIIETITGAVVDLNGELSGESRDAIHNWGVNFRIALISIEAEIMRLAMLLDKLGGTMTSAKMLLYGPGRALGIESSTKRFEAAADANMEYERRYMATDKALAALALKQIKLEESLTASGRAKSKAELDALEKRRLASAAARIAAEKGADADEAAAKKAKQLSDEWKSTLAGMKAEVEKAKIDDAFKQQIFEIEKKAQELKDKFGKIPGAKKTIDALTAELMDTEAVKQGKKDYEEWLSIKREADEAGKREREEAAKEEIELRGKIKAAREGEIQAQLAELDLAEALGKSHTDTLTERIRLMEESKAGQEADLLLLNKMTDPAAWYAQSGAIDQTNQKLAELRKELNAATGSMEQGFARGWQDWINNAKSAFDHGKELAGTVANSMQQSFSSAFFDAFKGELKSFQDYWSSFCDSIMKAFSNILAEMLAKWIATQAAMQIKQMAGGLNLLTGVLGAATAAPVSSPAPTTGSVGFGYAPFTSAFHTGGVVGIDTVRLRYVPPLAMAFAPRLHQGLAPDEYPAILQRGEGVFTAGQMKELGKGMGGNNVNVSLHIPFSLPFNDKKLASALRSEIEGKLPEMVENVVKRHM